MGLRQRFRPIQSPATNGGADCVDLTETEACSIPCSVDCTVSTWAEWTPCQGICASTTGVRTRIRTELVGALKDGAPCPALIATENCTEPCSITLHALEDPQQTHATTVHIARVSETHVRITVRSNTTGFVAVSVPSVPGSMLQADAVIGWASATTSSVSDYHVGTLREFSCPDGVCLDASQDIADVTATEVDGFTTVSFVRPRISTDPLGDYNMVDGGALQYLNLAVGDRDVIGAAHPLCLLLTSPQSSTA